MTRKEESRKVFRQKLSVDAHVQEDDGRRSKGRDETEGKGGQYVYAQATCIYAYFGEDGGHRGSKKDVEQPKGVPYEGYGFAGAPFLFPGFGYPNAAQGSEDIANSGYQCKKRRQLIKEHEYDEEAPDEPESVN